MDGDSTSYRKIILIAVVVGIISGIGALLFFWGLQIATQFFMGDLLGYQMPLEGQSPEQISQWIPPPNVWLILPIICFGGLLSGILVYKFAPEAAGHGTDAAIKAFHGDGKVRRRIPLLKAVTSILTISTGGSAGREGPTAQISAGFGSLAADLMGMSTKYRRIAVATGIGAGIGTIFTAPLGGAILAAEILYTRDFESDAIIPAFIASVIGYSIFGVFEGFEPVFHDVDMSWTISQIPLYMLLGVACAGVGLLYVRTFYGTTRFFNDLAVRHHIPGYVKPMLGAFLVGLAVIALSFIGPNGLTLGLAGMGTGYGYVQLAIYSMVPIGVLIILPFFKIITTSLTIGSGGSGGVFAPGLVIGGATGGAIGMLLHLAVPSVVPLEAVPVFVIIGMIALFGSIANAPIAVMIMVVEMTGNFSLLVPAMGAVAISTVLTGEETIYVEQVRTKAQSPAHSEEYLVEILQEICAGDSMTPAANVITLSPDEPYSSVTPLIDETLHTGFPVLENGKLTGIITIGDIRTIKTKKWHCRSVGDCMTHKLITITPQTDLEAALTLMIQHNIHHLPVVDSDQPWILVGFLTSSDILRSYSKRSSELNP